MALTSNKSIQFRNLDTATYDVLPVSGATTVYQSAILGMTSDGYVLHASDTGTLTGVGIAVEFADNSTGVSGDKSVKVYTSGEIALTTQGTVKFGDPVYVNTDVKVAVSGSDATAGVFVGHAMEAHETLANTRWVKLDGPRKTGYTFPV